MPQIKITIEEIVEVPEGTEIVLAPTGVVSGLRLPDDQFIKPWIAYEHFEGRDDSGDPEGDLGTDELNELGVYTALDFQREIEVVEGEVPSDASQIQSNEDQIS